MNPYKIFSIILGLTTVMTSCKKSFLETPPLSTASVDVVYHTDNDFLNAVTGTYSLFEGQYANFWVFGDLRSDVSKQYVPSNTTLLSVDNFTLQNNNTLLSGTWANYYSIISRANTILAKIATADSTVVTHKSRDIGEVEFLRALAYFDLVRIFGPVPKITTVVTIAQGYTIPRDSVDDIYNNVIIKDLLDASTRLPATYTGTDVGRATLGAAKSLLGKVYLTRHDFTDAEARLQEVTTLGYALVPSFNRLFDYTQTQHHSEYIFDIEYLSGGIGLGSVFTNTFIPNSVQMATFYGVNGSRLEANSPTDSLIAAYPAGDLRKDITVAVKGGWIDGGGNFVPLLATTSQSYTKKYLTSVPSDLDSKANWIVLRYADVLLMYAEALNENGKTSTALGYLNQVHTRAGLTAYGTLTQADMREKIYQERRLELAFEGQRWFDLVRTGRAYSTMQSSGMQPYMTVFPVPLNQIQLINNPSLFPQNPGYN